MFLPPPRELRDIVRYSFFPSSAFRPCIELQQKGAKYSDILYIFPFYSPRINHNVTKYGFLCEAFSCSIEVSQWIKAYGT
jgi:hypothetical protein